MGFDSPAFRHMTSTSYHITLAKNLTSIMSEGLIPQIGERSQMLGEKDEAIYLFPTKADVTNALLQWLGEMYDDDEELALLEINTTRMHLVPSIADYEIKCLEPIPPHCITLLETL